MDEKQQNLYKEYNENPTPGTFQRLVSFLREHGEKEVVQKIRMEYISNFSMNEEMWLEWLIDEYNAQGDNSLYNQLLSMALNDLPLSTNIRKFQIEKAEEKDKLPLIKQSIEIIGDFDNTIWDLYRKENPSRIDEIYIEQLSHPIPDYDAVLGEYNLHQMMDNNPPFEPTKEVKELIDKIKLHRADFQTLSGAIEHVKAFPDVKSFEYSLSLYPYSSQLWIDYLNHFPTASLASRAVRFCPTSGLLWAKYSKITNKVNSAGFRFIKDQSEAQLLLGQLVTLDRSNAVSIIKEAIESPAFSEKDNWIWPTFLLEEQLKRKGSNLNGADLSFTERKALFEAAVERNSQSIELWNKLVSIVSETNDEEQIRNVYRKAVSKLRVNLPVFIQNWIIFEASSKENKMDEIISVLNQIGYSEKVVDKTENSENDKSDSISKDYEKRTIFVAGFKEQITEEDLLHFFSQVGEVESVRLKRSHGKPSFSFVQFRHQSDADQAVRMLNGATFRGSQIEVKPHQTQNKLTLFIRYATNAQPGELIEFIKEKTQLSNFKLRLANEKNSVKPEDGKEIPMKTKGWGFIDVSNDADAMKIMALSGKLFKTQVLKVEVAKKNQKEAHFDNLSKPEKKQTFNTGRPKNDKSQKNQDLQQKTEKKEEEAPKMTDDQLKDFFGL